MFKQFLISHILKSYFNLKFFELTPGFVHHFALYAPNSAAIKIYPSNVAMHSTIFELSLYNFSVFGYDDSYTVRHRIQMGSLDFIDLVNVRT